MNSQYYPFPHEQTAFTFADDQAVIIMADTGQVTVLNKVATRVWQLADGKHNLEAVEEILCKEFEATKEIIHSDVENFIQEMIDIGAIVLLEEPSEM